MVDLPAGSAVVVVNFYAGLLGGPVSQLLKCLTAVKICEEFEKNGSAAVPVCLVRRDAPAGFLPRSINFVGRGSKLHCLKPSERKADTPEPAIDGADFKKLFEEIEKIFPYAGGETLPVLKDAFAPGKNFVSACVRWLKYLLKDFGAVIAEYDSFTLNKNPGNSDFCCLPRSRVFQPAAFVMDSAEIAEYEKARPQSESAGGSRPIVRRCPDVTISTARNLKTLKRYGLEFARLFDGKERVMDYVRDTFERDVPARLQKLREETGIVLNELKTTVFDAGGGRIYAERADRILYQLEKMQKHSENALADKENTAERRICKACDSLAPYGRRQQDELCGAQIPLYYGLTGLRRLYERIDITTLNRQLIEMD